jgi:hypothetical protein
MGTYASLAVYDRYGNIIGYYSTTTGEMVEWTAASSPEFQRIFALSHPKAIEYELEHDASWQFYLDNPDFLEIM